MAKLVIPRNSLPPIDSLTERYEMRYRLITENRNRISSWTPIFSVDPEFEYVVGNIDISKSSNVVNISWDTVEIMKENNIIGNVNNYDIWIRWEKTYIGDWIYKERVLGNFANILIPDSYFYNDGNNEALEKPNAITVEVYAVGQPIIRETNLLLYSPPTTTI
jgi:hypothetical protein